MGAAFRDGPATAATSVDKGEVVSVEANAVFLETSRTCTAATVSGAAAAATTIAGACKGGTADHDACEEAACNKSASCFQGVDGVHVDGGRE